MIHKWKTRHTQYRNYPEDSKYYLDDCQCKNCVSDSKHYVCVYLMKNNCESLFNFGMMPWSSWKLMELNKWLSKYEIQV